MTTFERDDSVHGPDTHHVRFPGESEAYRREWHARNELAKKIAANLAKFSTSPQAAMVPDSLRTALADLSVLVVSLAQESHGKFDQFPFDLPTLARRVDKIEGLT